VNQSLKSVVREICMLRSVGVGAPIWCPFYPAELEIGPSLLRQLSTLPYFTEPRFAG
jgi:hypothetical protein